MVTGAHQRASTSTRARPKLYQALPDPRDEFRSIFMNRFIQSFVPERWDRICFIPGHAFQRCVMGFLVKRKLTKPSKDEMGWVIMTVSRIISHIRPKDENSASLLFPLTTWHSFARVLSLIDNGQGKPMWALRLKSAVCDGHRFS
jgi:hypothetical protein